MAPAPRQVAAGSIRYHIGFIAHPGRRAHADLFSEELSAQIRRRNVPESRIVYFDGRYSRTEEVNVDYGVRSRSLVLRSAGSDRITYCKELSHFGFCVEYSTPPAVGGPPPDFAPALETATIAGFRCRKGEYRGNRHLMVWYTEEVAVNDPTGAVLQLEGVPGFILQTEEIPASDDADGLRVTVVELTFDAPPPGIYSVPANYRRFAGIDAARAEDRRMLDQRSAEELVRNPLAAGEREMFVGTWRYDTLADKIRVDIVPRGDNEFRFQTTVLTAPAEAAGRWTDERACMQGRLLMVEDPPNYRLYRLENNGRELIQIGNRIFRFVRS